MFASTRFESVTARAIRIALILWLAVMSPVFSQGPTLHFVGIADTEAPGIGPHVQAGLSLVATAILGGMPKDRVQEHEALIGARCEIETMMSSVRSMQIAEGDTVVVYYAGHGSFDPNNGTLLLPQRNPGKGLRMRGIIDTIQKKKPRLLIMLVDCCQTPVSGQKIEIAGLREGGMGNEVPALQQSLFFNADPGIILLFATQRNQPVPCGIPMAGGIVPGTLFAEALRNSFSKDLGPQTWEQFGRVVKDRVNEKFAQHKRDASGNLVLSNNKRASVANQRVWAQWVPPDSNPVTIIDP